ncbi:MAG: glycine cleavage system protein H [Candidatus Poribacteria bacterium]
MSKRYTKNHEWILLEGADIAIVGITERRVLENGRIAYVELPAVGAEYEHDEPIAVIETNAGIEITYRSPATGEVTAVNGELNDEETLINNSPETDGWLFRLRVEFPADLESLMDESEYEFFEGDDDDPEDDDDEY